MTADRKTLACNWFPIPNSLDQAIANYCVLMLTCAVNIVDGVTSVARTGPFATILDRLCSIWTNNAIPMIVSVTVREEDLPSPDCAWGAA